MTDSYIEESKKNWYRSSGATTDDLKLGCLQRIAAATETMATEYNRLIRERDRLASRVRSLNSEVDRTARSNAALRGVITRMRKQREATK